MKIIKAVKLHLLATASVTTIVGQKVYLRRAPQKAGYPRIVVSMAAAEWITRSQARRQSGGTHVIKARVQVDCWVTGPTADVDVDVLAETIAKALDDYRGTMQGVVVRHCLQVDERDNYEPLEDASDIGTHRITQDYEIKYDEPT